ncbi:MAG: restriction endonuclease [Arenimonas sp.]
MQGSLLVVVAIVVAVGVALTGWWFGISRRRKAETELGIQALAAMKWRDGVALVLELLYRDGYRKTAAAKTQGDDSTEFLLARGDDRVLLGYKHGTAYQLSAANIGEFVNALHLRGARSGILVTLGSLDAAAIAAASAWNVQLIDGSALWTKVRLLIQPAMLDQVRGQASRRTRNGLYFGLALSFLAGAVVYAVAGSTGSALPAAAVARPAAKPAPAPAVIAPSVPGSDAAMLTKLKATARAMADVAKLSDAEREQRRADIVRKIALLPEIDTASWSAQRTLLVTLNRTDGKDKELVDEVCRIMTQYEELRFTRVQLDPPIDSGLAVRWRLCG